MNCPGDDCDETTARVVIYSRSETAVDADGKSVSFQVSWPADYTDQPPNMRTVSP